MGPHFQVVDRSQAMLMPPSVEDWVSDDHLAWCLLDTLDELDLSPIYADYNADGAGRAAIDPKAMLAVLVYGYANKVVSSRKLETLCKESVVYRLLSCNFEPDHTTIHRFRDRHSERFQHLFIQVLAVCREAGLGKAGTIILDGTKLKANAALDQTKTLETITKELVDLAASTDMAEDKSHGKGLRGDELPAALRHRETGRKRLQEAKGRLEMEAAAKALEQARKIETREREERQSGQKKRGRKPKPPEPEPAPEAKANVTDPDSRVMKTRAGFMQSFNGQAMVTKDQIILAADLVQDANDQGQLIPMVRAAKANLEAVGGGADEIGRCLADAGYCSEDNLEGLEAESIEGFIATANRHKARQAAKEGPPRGRIPKHLSRRERMERKLRTKAGRTIYKTRGKTVEPVFGQTKDGLSSLPRRSLVKAKADWSLLCAAHNLKKLWRAQRAA